MLFTDFTFMDDIIDDYEYNLNEQNRCWTPYKFLENYPLDIMYIIDYDSKIVRTFVPETFAEFVEDEYRKKVYEFLNGKPEPLF